MSTIEPEVINALGTLQAQIWEEVSATVSEASKVKIEFGNALTVPTDAADLAAELSSPKLTLQFAFAGNPEHRQAVILAQEAYAGLVTALAGEEVKAVDETQLDTVHPILEAIAQGICAAATKRRGEAVVADEVNSAFEILTLPSNLNGSDPVIRVNVAFSGENLAGSAVWLIDGETAEWLLNDEPAAADEPFAQASPVSSPAQPIHHDDSSLELLMDIPLEISVELGRVKMVVKDVVDLGAGSIVEIDKAAGEPVDVLVNGRLVARGEVVVIEDNFGVRITEILSPQDRLNRLSEAA